jgi:predicted DNA-binding ribbon-helix-helix protein
LKSPIVKRSVALAGHNTSVSLEDAFWRGLKDIARSRRTTLSNLINSIDLDRDQGNSSSALRLFVLDHYQMRPLASLMAPTLTVTMRPVRP